MSIDTTLSAIQGLHLLRPQWLWALLAIPVFVWAWRARQRRSSVWRDVVDAHLLPHLLDVGSQQRGRHAMWLGMLGFTLAVLALAGPSWRQVEQPLWQSRAPLVIAMDLSAATLAGDLPPSRLAQARAKLGVLLRERAGGQVGLVAYAGDAYTVAPLTDDAANVALFLDALHPQVMPVDGQRSDRAISWSTKLLQQAGFDHGQILLLTDHADAAALAAAASARSSGYRVSVLGLGSEAGAPFRGPGGSLGNARLDPGSLRQLASAGGGDFVALASDAADLHALGVLDPAIAADSAQDSLGRTWQDEGYWLLLPLLVLGLLAFRRGALAVLVVCVWLPWQPAVAADLWRRPDQVAHRQMEQASQAYREKDYERAAELYRGLDSADAHYNRGNALAKAGKYPQAIQAYDHALRKQPGMADAIANRRAVEAAMKRKPPPGPKDDPGNQKPGDDPKPGQDGKPSQDGEGEPGDAPPKPGEAEPTQPPGDPSESAGKPPPPEAARPADSQNQQAADAAQRERMERALENARKAGEQPAEDAAPVASETPAQRERRLANEAWLRRVPDNPGGLLREKFRIEHERRQLQGTSGE